MTQIGTNSDTRHPSPSRARRSGGAPVVFAAAALVLAALGLGGACGGDVETNGSGSTGSTGSSSGGVDCSNVGCGAPPLCSTGCQETCGCCSCGEGEVVNDPQHGPLVCNGGCYEPAMPDGGSGDASDEMDCSLVGCGPPPLCGEACSEFCGCCNCAPNETFMMDGKTYKCAADGECYEPVP